MADKLTEQLQQGGKRTADKITANAQTLTQQIIQPEARQLAEQVCPAFIRQFGGSPCGCAGACMMWLLRDFVGVCDLGSAMSVCQCTVDDQQWILHMCRLSQLLTR